MARLKIGDLVKIQTGKGLAFAQYSHKHPRYGSLLRVLPGFFSEAPENLAEIVSQPPRFVAFFPLSQAVDQGIVEIVGNAPIPSSGKEFPTFRAGVVDPSTGKVAVWWLWDGVNEWRVGTLSPEQRKFPIRGVWNDTLLIERIETGWTPENDPT